jgi:DUF917 family protein
MQLHAGNLASLARGCALLAGGGGGNPALALTMALHAVRQHGPVDVLDPGGLQADAVVLPCGMIGAPTIAEERIWNGDEGRTLCEVIAGARGHPVDVLLALQIGGANGLLPVMWAARLGLALLDADGAGRAFPRLDQHAMCLAGIAPGPVVLTDGRGNTLLLDPADDAWAERLARSALAGLGGVCAGACYCMTGEQAPRATIASSVSLALALGEAMRADDVHQQVWAACETLGGTVLIEGRIRALQRHSDTGFMSGSATVAGTAGDTGRQLHLELQNEFLLALEDGVPCAAVPDLIAVLSSDTGSPLGVEDLRYGQHVIVLTSPAPSVWRSREGLAIAGPAAFGYDFEPRSEGAQPRHA